MANEGADSEWSLLTWQLGRLHPVDSCLRDVLQFHTVTGKNPVNPNSG